MEYVLQGQGHTDIQIKALKPEQGKRYSKADTGGLLLDISPGGVRSWLYRYRLNGKREKVVIGHYPDVSLKEARGERDKLAAKVRAGISPFQERKLARTGLPSEPTLREFGDRYYKEQVEKGKDPKQVRRYLDSEIYPILGDRKFREITALDVQALVYRKRDNGFPKSAMRIRMVLKETFDYAIELQLVPMNPASMVAPRYIGKATRRRRNLSPKEIREYVRVVYRSNMRRQFKLALHIILLTLVRKSMLLLAQWNEFDFEVGEWTIPKEHMKGRKGEEHEHTVYMSTQVQDLFRELRELAGGSELVLPGRSSLKKPFARNALNKALEGLTFNMDPFTIHDLRRTASTQLSEHGWAENVIEKALSHEKGGVAGIYNRAEYAVERKKMLQWWADYVNAIVTEEKVIIGAFKREAG
jgi:integrase